MITIRKVLMFAVLTFGSYMVFGLAGQFSALAVLALAPESAVVGWLMYVLALGFAAAIPAVLWFRRRADLGVSQQARVMLAGFTAFFCWQWTVAGTPDWNPLPLAIGFAVCAASAVAVLRLTARGDEQVADPGSELLSN